jgi:hypothetical protein
MVFCVRRGSIKEFYAIGILSFPKEGRIMIEAFCNYEDISISCFWACVGLCAIVSLLPWGKWLM